MDARRIINVVHRLLVGTDVPVQKRRPVPQNPFGWSDEFIASPEFLRTNAWKRFRYDTIRQWRRCRACGCGAAQGAVLNVDHIIPRKKRPDLALDPRNTQCLCSDCNHGKGNRYADDWR